MTTKKSAITETPWTLETSDGATIYGVKSEGVRPSNAAIFLVHGLTGHMYEYALKRAADHFASNYDVYRFNLYSGEPGGRLLTDCTLQTHANDLHSVMNHFTPAYEKVFAIGHSYGGPTIMIAKPDRLTAASLWDPSFNIKRMWESSPEQCLRLNEDLYAITWGTSYLIGKEMMDMGNRLDEQACIKLSRDFGHPVQVLFAEGGIYIKDKYSYHSFGHEKKYKRCCARHRPLLL